MGERLSGITLPTNGPYGDYNAALGECYPDIMWGDTGGAEAMWDAGKLPFIHYMFKTGTEEATIQNIAAGMFDEQIEAALRNLKAYCDTGRKAVVVYLPEMNGNWCVYATDDYSRSDFITAWYNFAHMADDIGLDKTMVKFCWAPNDTGWLTLEDWYPGDAYVDIIGASAYNWGGIFEGEPWESFTELADRYVREVRGFTEKPIVITQTGALNGSGQREWLDDMVYYIANYDNVEGAIYYNEMQFELSADCDWNQQISALDSRRPDWWFTSEGDEMPTMIPFAIDVTDQVPVSGKPWTGAGEPKLVVHTIEGADPWEIGWPRSWPGQTAPPHLYMNSDRFPDGDWLYQTLPFDVAGYSVRDNALEDNHGFFQMETAGQAANTPTYPDSYYEALAVVADWFVVNMGMDPRIADFSCAEYGTNSPCRWTDTEVDAFSGVLGHCHVGINVDSHWDPGKLDTVRLEAFMSGGTPIPPPVPEPDGTYRTVTNVPDAQWARNVVNRMMCLGIISEGDGSDWEKALKNGTIWNYLYRYTDAIQRNKIDDC